MKNLKVIEYLKLYYILYCDINMKYDILGTNKKGNFMI